MRDLRRGTTRLVTGAIKADAGSPSLSADGRYVAFVVRVGRPNGKRESLRSRVWRHDLQTGQDVLVSRAAGARGEPRDGLPTDPAISVDGRRVAFASTAGNLAEGKPDGIAGVYVRDIVARDDDAAEHARRRPGTGRRRRGRRRARHRLRVAGAVRVLEAALSPDSCARRSAQTAHRGGTDGVTKAGRSSIASRAAR